MSHRGGSPRNQRGPSAPSRCDGGDGTPRGSDGLEILDISDHHRQVLSARIPGAQGVDRSSLPDKSSAGWVLGPGNLPTSRETPDGPPRMAMSSDAIDGPTSTDLASSTVVDASHVAKRDPASVSAVPVPAAERAPDRDVEARESRSSVDDSRPGWVVSSRTADRRVGLGEVCPDRRSRDRVAEQAESDGSSALGTPSHWHRRQNGRGRPWRPVEGRPTPLVR